MNAGLESNLLSTSLTSSISTHQHLKNMSEQFGCSEDIISRFAMSLSMKNGAVNREWQPQPLNKGLTVLKGKVIKGKTLFKSELPLFLVMLAVAEPEAETHEVRELLRLHWERGVETMVKGMGNLDWLEYLSNQFYLVK